jgi:hypothetical protein
VAEDLAQERPLAAPARPQSRAERARRTAYRYRFGAIYVILAAIVGAAVGSFIVLAGRPDAPAEAEWSSWKPDGSRIARVRQIADHVSNRYRLPVFAIGGSPQVTVPDQGDLAVSAIAVRPDTSRGQAEEGDIDVYQADDAISFKLCGGGTGCSINQGRASEARLQLLRREALELSLFAFKYAGDVKSVVVFLPPSRPDADGNQRSTGALFLRRSNVEKQLDEPLARSLTSPPPAIGTMSAAESDIVDRLTSPHIYAYTYTQSADGSPILVLAA